MHVGIFLDGKVPTDGGGYTFIHDVVSAAIQQADQSRHRFTLFCSTDFAQAIASNIPVKVDVCPMVRRGRVGYALRELRHASPAFGILWSRPGTLERQALARGVEVMWFIGGAFDTLNMPYFTTVWDVQHRTHPWFPEVSSGGVWEHREAFFSRHLGRASRIITGTEVGKRELLQFYGVGEDRIRILRHPTPRFALDARRQASPPRNLVPGYLYYPAQFWPHKNHANLLLGYRQFRDRTPDAPKLVFTGAPKNNYAFIRKLVAELELGSSVEFFGFVSLEEMIGLYVHAGALTYASFSGPENLPPLEAFALGCPVAASDFPGAREQLGDAAMFFSPHDPGSIADTMRRVLLNGPHRDSLVEKGRLRAASWTSADFVSGIFSALDEFESERRAWGLT